MIHQVYIIYSKKFDRLYVGVTKDLSRRLYQHNHKETPSTAGGSPWILLWSTAKPSRIEAEKLERKLKNLTRARKVRFMMKYNEDLAETNILDAILY